MEHVYAMMDTRAQTVRLRNVLTIAHFTVFVRTLSVRAVRDGRVMIVR